MKLLRDASGQGVLEYGLILGIIAMLAVGTLLMLGNETNSTFARLGGSMGASSSTTVGGSGGTSTISGE